MEAMHGMKYLERAMDFGHLDATYSVGMILILQEGQARDHGMQIIRDLMKPYRTTTKIQEIRHKFLAYLLWNNNTFIMGREMPKCCKKHWPTDAGWQYFEDANLDCQDCICHQEVVYLWKYLPNSI